MSKIIFERTIGFARYLDSNVHKELLEILSEDYDPKCIFKNKNDELKIVLNDLAYLDYSSWILNTQSNKNTILDLWTTNIEKISNIKSSNLNSILTFSFDYNSHKYLDTILKSKGENYLLQRLNIFKNVEEYPIIDLDLLVLNVRELETTSGYELLEKINPKNINEAKSMILKFLIQQITYHNTIIL